MRTRHKISKFLIGLLLCVSLMAVAFFVILKPSVTVARAYTPPSQFAETQSLSELTKSESIDFILQNNVEIPNGWVNRPGFDDYVKGIIEAVEVNPNYTSTASWDVVYDFVESVKAAVNMHKGISQTPTQTQSIMPLATYQLQNNWVKNAAGNWVSNDGYWGDDNLWNYNCYAFAIDMTIRPPQYTTNRQYQPGDFAGTGQFNDTISIYDLALIVKADLHHLGYGNISVDLTAPNLSTLGADETLISIRRTTTGYWSEQDYHFMRYEKSDGWWYHKPGFSAILRYKHHPGFKNWGRESSGWGSESSGGSAPEYDSAVYYIRYSKHPFTATVSGGNATITGVKSGVTLLDSVEIPSTVSINGINYPVTAIGNSTFSNQTQLSQITIPASVTSIDANAFPKNIHVSLAEGRTQIQIGLFQNQTQISQISIPSSVSNIDSGAFQGTTNLQAVNIGGNNLINVSNFNDYIDYGHTDISLDVALSAGITYRFSFDYEITSTLNLSVKLGVGDDVFEDSLVSPHEFSTTKGQKTIEFTPTASQLVTSNKLWCRFTSWNMPIQSPRIKITNINLECDSQLQKIGDSAFKNSSIYQIAIPTSVTTIGNSAFAGCKNLSGIVLATSVTTIGDYAFEKCTNLTIYTEYITRPSQWSEYWIDFNCTVIWNCTIATTVGYSYVVAFNKTSTSITNGYRGMSVPYRENYIFAGWYNDPSFNGVPYFTSEALHFSISTGMFYAKWLSPTVAWDGSVATGFAGGGGTHANPYQINNGEQLAYLANQINSIYNWSNGLYFVLTRNINLGSRAWTPIGTSASNSFNGNFDGRGYIISNIWINKSEDYQGLFGYVVGGTISNVDLLQGSITGRNRVGGIAGYVERGTIASCLNTASVSNGEAKNEKVGGIVGYAFDSTLLNCTNAGAIFGYGGLDIGGLAGKTQGGTVRKCYNVGKVSGNPHVVWGLKYMGRLIGWNRGTRVIS